MIKYISATPCESIVDITGKIVVPKEPIKKCTQQVELQITKFFVVNRSVPQLPIQLLDASRKVIGN
jgi:aspartyl-tRNA synthetase